MQFKEKGIITVIEDMRTTKQGMAVQQFHFEHEGKIIYPSLLGCKVDLVKGLLPGDVVEIEGRISGHISQAGKPYNNLIVDNLVRV